MTLFLAVALILAAMFALYFLDSPEEYFQRKVRTRVMRTIQYPRVRQILESRYKLLRNAYV